ncbi:hypothetical protein WICPIJ_004030 [Wickerhamomyces pijperi]|uniref:Cytochrome b5 heme-binding domain-containing protein n=1 Tax=Wickerhamomyces pijperi TaxID=599730 RepID=A0A9P8Q6D6_WICPI|nr:hypothetical protein WICPIJ_004030 [Wickerhamomyces pijperi]
MSTVYTFEEVQKHNTKDDLWMIINGKVYDVTKYIDEHPGGEEVLIDCGGVDATDPFDDIGHSEDAREALVDLLVGTVDPASLPAGSSSTESSGSSSATQGESNTGLIIAALLVLVSIGAYVFLNK